MSAASTHCTAMNLFPSAFGPQPDPLFPSGAYSDTLERLKKYLFQELEKAIGSRTGGLEAVIQRIATEVDRVCQMSDRIQNSGQILRWQQSLAQHRLNKCLQYYRLGSQRGRGELHSSLSSIVYRYIAPGKSQLGFEGRYGLLEDFMQMFYIEALNAFRREHGLVEDYTPRMRLELAEYMAFCEQYAKRRIRLRNGHSQQLIVLRAQGFARRLPEETSVDMATVMEAPKTEEGERYGRNPVVQQMREQLVTEAPDLADGVMRDRVIQTLFAYLEEQDQQDCIDYITLKLEDCSAPEIDQILNLSPRQRDYLQQRVKYHIEKFSQVHEWELVHQWLGADLEQRLGLTPEEWAMFMANLTPDQCALITAKQQHPDPLGLDDQTLSQTLGWTSKKVQRVWSQILGLARKYRNQG